MKKLSVCAVMAVIASSFVSCSDKNVDDARRECIQLNQEYNRLYQKAMLEYMSGNTQWGLAAGCLQEIMPELLNVNKALGIDCTQYDENGEPVMMEHPNGERHPVEIIPDEIR